MGEPEGAGPESIKLQFRSEFGPWIPESQVTCVTRGVPCGWMETIVLTNPPLNDATIVAACATAVAPAVTVKVAEVDPDATKTLPGTASGLLLPVRLTVAPPLPAACVNNSVHVAAAPEFSTAGVQVNDAGLKDIVTLTEVETELLL
jgi:hypothetical protein